MNAERTLSVWIRTALASMAVLIAALTGIRFRRHASEYCRSHILPHHHGPFMAPAFAVLTSVFGIVLVVLLVATP